MKLLSDQVDEREIAIIVRELTATLANGVPGDVVEFGCYVGTTSVYLAQNLPEDRILWLYDSFEGLPEKAAQDESPAGLQFRAGELLATKKQLEYNFRSLHLPRPVIKKAWFSDLTDAAIPETIAFAFLDGDYYHSVLDPLKLIWDHLSPGACIIVDDYANEALPGAAKAVEEWRARHHFTVKTEHSLAIFHKK